MPIYLKIITFKLTHSKIYYIAENALFNFVKAGSGAGAGAGAYSLLSMFVLIVGNEMVTRR